MILVNFYNDEIQKILENTLNELDELDTLSTESLKRNSRRGLLKFFVNQILDEVEKEI